METERGRLEQENAALRAEVVGKGAGTSDAQARVEILEREKNELLQQVVDIEDALQAARTSMENEDAEATKIRQGLKGNYLRSHIRGSSIFYIISTLPPVYIVELILHGLVTLTYTYVCT
ncbi:MAG: hypothetical protein Alis3KO_41110 [Aliiglaciecola sp.]